MIVNTHIELLNRTLEAGDEKEIREYRVEELKMKQRHKKNKDSKEKDKEKELTPEELKELEKLEKIKE